MKVLFVANIGTNSDGFYHVGDEAMFLETYNWYKKHHPNYELNTLTSQPNHQNLKITEIISPISFQSFRIKKTLSIMIKLFIFKFFKKNILNQKEKKLFSVIKNNNRIHFCGGGNISSLFHDWLYYSLSIIIIALFLKKEIILTSQTIGPFKFKDKIIVKTVLNKVKIIAVRGDKKDIISLGIKKPKLFDMLDAAYTLPTKSNIKIPSKKKFRIGLSLHEWKNNINFAKKLIKDLNKINLNQKIEVILIPHVIVNNKNEWGMGFMNSLFDSKNNFKIIEPKIEEILSSVPEPAYSIKKITSTCDLLITTRYHGLIFALSQNIPTLSFVDDEYYFNKNSNAIKRYYPNNLNKYLLNDNFIQDNQIYLKLKKMISNNTAEKKHITKINSKLLKKYDLFYNNLNQHILN